ncbi:MAG: methylase [Rhodocyclaceae bacterium]|nr:methylase [Rhodocyclaceae bacterium]
MKHGDGQITQLVASFEQFGFNGVIVIDEDNVVLAGHGRRLAAIRAGMATVPCLRRTGLTDAQKRAYIIADNKIGRESEWDVEVLEKLLQELNGAGLDLDSLGISAAALATITAPQGKGASAGRRASGERAKPSPVKLDGEKLLHLVSDLAYGIQEEGRAQTSALIGRIDGISYQLVATSAAESERIGLGDPVADIECLVKREIGKRSKKNEADTNRV